MPVPKIVITHSPESYTVIAYRTAGFYQGFNMDKEVDVGLEEKQKKKTFTWVFFLWVPYYLLLYRYVVSTADDRSILRLRMNNFATGNKKSPVPPYKIHSAIPTHQKQEHDPLLYYLKKDKHELNNFKIQWLSIHTDLNGKYHFFI